MNAIAPGPIDSARSSTPHWRGSLSLTLARRAQATRVVARRHRGPMLIQRPFYPEGADCCHIYLLHPPGGLVGGDHLDCRFELQARSHGLITTPAAGKAYRIDALDREQGQHTMIDVAEGAVLEWLPQETIAFSGARLHNRTRIDFSADACVLGWDILCLGRPAAGETFVSGSVRQDLELWCEGRPRLLDRAFYPAQSPIMQAPWGLAGQPICGTLFAAWPADAEHNPAPDRPALLHAVRQGIESQGYPGQCQATLVDDTLLVRALGTDTEALRHTFIRLWEVLRPLLIGRRACAPRIWHT